MNPHFESRERWFLKLRAEWFRVMRPLGSWVPWELRNEVQLQETDEAPSFAFNSPSAWGEGLIQPAPQLREEHLRDCVVVPERRGSARAFGKRRRGRGSGYASRGVRL